jgi:hypothetical protein
MTSWLSFVLRADTLPVFVMNLKNHLLTLATQRFAKLPHKQRLQMHQGYVHL